MKTAKIIIFLVICILSVIYFSNYLQQRKATQPTADNPQTQQSNNQHTFVYEGKPYAYNYFSVPDVTLLILIPNFYEKYVSSDIAAQNSCQKGISGGFYDTEGNPLGGFKAKGTVIKNPVKNRLIDGFFWRDGDKIKITTGEPSKQAEFFLQTGPLLMLNGRQTRLAIANDEYRRRNIAGITLTGAIIFMIIYNPDSVYEGPLLSEMPDVMSKIIKVSTISFKDVINLDGGSASAFVSKEKTLQEFSPIGSFFCVK